MLDSRTEIRSPHDARHVPKGGRWETEIHDSRVSVSMQEQGATLRLFFDPDSAWTGEAPLLEVRLEPPAAGKFEPWQLMPQLPLYLQYAQASLAHKQHDVTAAIRALRQVNSTRRGLSDDFLWLVAKSYDALTAEGEPHPTKALARLHFVDKSTASRWVTAARARGYLPASEPDSLNKEVAR